MKVFTTMDRALIDRGTRLAESNEFAIFALDNDTYALVLRHEGVEWQGVTLSGDGLFRVAELLVKAMRTLYRGVASQLSPKNRSRPET